MRVLVLVLVLTQAGCASLFTEECKEHVTAGMYPNVHVCEQELQARAWRGFGNAAPRTPAKTQPSIDGACLHRCLNRGDSDTQCNLRCTK
jgi:hypothetical protein